MNRVTRAEKVLDSLANAGAITPCGKDWLTAAVDPFHDNQLPSLQGWPDMETGSSVVRCVKQSITIARPVQIPATDNWDCHVVQWPWLTATQTGSSAGCFASTLTRSEQTYTFTNPPVVFAPLGGLQVFAQETGTNLAILQQPGSGTYQVGRLAIDETYTQGAGRLVGMGFEVHNTTAQLNLQGSVCVYRQMADSRSPSTYVGISGTDFTIFSGVPVRYPPSNLAEALLLQGSKQWEAKEGCYVVSAFNTIENPAHPISPQVPIVSAADQDDLEGSINVTALNIPIPGTALAGSNILPVIPLRVHPVHQSGAIFTGLSPTTTLTLNWNVYYESFPGPAEASILALATPSCPFDPASMAIYESCMVKLPVGVMVKENGMGDWFLNAISEASKFVAPLLIGSGNPLAMGAGALVDYVGRTAGGYGAKPRKGTQLPMDPAVAVQLQGAKPAQQTWVAKGQKSQPVTKVVFQNQGGGKKNPGNQKAWDVNKLSKKQRKALGSVLRTI